MLEKFACLTATCGEVLLRSLKRELMEIIETYLSEEDSQHVKKLITQKLNNAYKKIKFSAYKSVLDKNSFLQKLKDLEAENKKKIYLN